MSVVAGARKRLEQIEAPYKGLTYFTEADSEIFFGRDAERSLIATTLLASRFTVVYGESGVGKSSLLRAGAIHDLRERALEERTEGADGPARAPRFIPVVVSDWRDDPVRACEQSIRSAATGLVTGPLPEPFAGRRFDDLVELWCKATGATLLIVLDQFEEYLLYHLPEDDESLGAGLARALNRRDLSVRFIVSIREDSLAKLDRYETSIPNLFDNLIRVEHLDKEAAEEAIRSPIDRYNAPLAPDERIGIEDELVAKVLADVERDEEGVADAGSASEEGGSRVETAFLQLVMERLWDEEQKATSRLLRTKTYDDLGGARRIVFAHLQDAMDSLGSEQQAIAAKAFGRLVTPSLQKIACLPSDLAKEEKVEPDQMMGVLERLALRRIVRQVAPLPGKSESRYEIFHDKLAEPILAWRAGYLEEAEREAARARALDQLRQERRRRRLWSLAIGAGAVIALTVASTITAIWFAARERDISHSRYFAAQAVAAIPVDPDQSVQIAARAVRTRPTPQAVAALRQALTESRVRRVFRGVRDVTGIGFSADGRRLIATQADGNVRIWDLASGGAPFVIQGDRDLGATISPDGSRLLVGRHLEYELWDTVSRLEVGVFPQSAFEIPPVFSPDGRYIVGASGDRVTVWDARNLRAVLSLRAGVGDVSSLALSPSGRRLAVVSYRGDVVLWDLGTATRTVLRGHVGPIANVAFDPAGGLLVTVGFDNAARIWDAKTGRVIQTMRDPVTSASFSRDGRLLLTIGNRAARVWDTRTWDALSIRQNNDYVSSGVFSFDGRYAMTAGQDGTAWIWGVRNGQTLLQLRGHTDTVIRAVFSPDRVRAATVSRDGSVRVWDVLTGRDLRGTTKLRAAAYSNDGSLIATAGEDRVIRIWNASNLAPVGELRGDVAALTSVAFAPGGKRLVTSSMDGTARVWDVATGRAVGRSLRSDSGVIEPTFSPDGTLVVAGSGNDARIWRVGSDAPFRRLSGHTDVVSDATFSPDGTYVAGASLDGTVRIWSARTGKTIRILDEHRAGVTSVAYSEDGRLLVTSSLDKTAIIWDSRTGKRLWTLFGHTAPVWDAEFDRTGTRVATASGDGTVRVWNVSDGRPLGLLRASATAVDTAAFAPGSQSRILIASEEGALIATCATCGSVEQLLHDADRQVARARLPR